MPQNQGTIENIALSFARLLQPLLERVEGGEARIFLAELGLLFPPQLDAKPGFTNAVNGLANNLRRIPTLTEELIDAVESEDVARIVQKGVDVIGLVKSVFDNVEAFATAVKNDGAGLPGISPADLNTFVQELPSRIIDYLVIANLESLPGAVEALEFFEAVERKQVNAGSFTYVKRKINFDNLTKILQSPIERLETIYKWNKPDFDGEKLLQTLQSIAAKSGVPAIYDPAEKTLDILFLELKPRTDLNPKGLDINLSSVINLAGGNSISQDDWTLELMLNGELKAGLQVTVQPNGDLTIVPPSGEFKGDSTLEFRAGKSNGDPYLIFGQAGGSRLEAKQLIARTGAGFAWNGSQGSGKFSIGGEVKGGKVVISLDQADGFLGEILSGFGLESSFDLGFAFTDKEGFHFYGSATLEIKIPLHVNLGIAEIKGLTLGFGIKGAEFPITIGADLKANLGPLVAVVENMGVSANLSLPADRKGNMGAVDLAFGFKPPNGVGLSLDVGVVKGGGYLYFDFDREEYAGVLELSILAIVTVKAIGLITTKMPDGSKGFSLLIIITAEFGTGIQLGFGFTLLGLGGLLGLNRTMNLPPLMEGVRTGAINSIMFPENPVENAPRIISDLRTIFPPYEGKFLIGPMAKLGWGTPTLVSVSLGVIIEIPGNIAILGILKIALPAEEAALILIQVNFAGAIEFDKKRLYFFASIFESRVLFLTIEGEMGLLVAWGDDANFVVSVGGFHPRFNPPPLPFPSPKRVAINILDTSVARIRVEGYFAVTSNTVQFGAKAELMFDVGVARVDGHIAFDALFQFSPFYFIIEISASISLKVFGIGLFSIRLQFALEGPTPWRAHGTGTLSLLFFDVSADFDITWGDSEDTTVPPVAVMPLLRAELEKIDNWKAELPAGSNLLVSLRKLSEAETAQVLHPLGTLRISQRAVPLDMKIDKVGSRKPSDANDFTLTPTQGLSKVTDTDEQFAKAQYLDLKDAEKLSQRAFDPLHGGLLLSSGAQQLGASKMAKRRVRYEQIIIDNNYKRFRRRFKRFSSRFFGHFLKGAAVSKSELSHHYKSQLDPFIKESKVAVKEGGFAVAFTENNKAYNGGAMHFASETLAQQFIQQQVAAQPELHEALHVIPQWEAV